MSAEENEKAAAAKQKELEATKKISEVLDAINSKKQLSVDAEKEKLEKLNQQISKYKELTGVEGLHLESLERQKLVREATIAQAKAENDLRSELNDLGVEAEEILKKSNKELIKFAETQELTGSHAAKLVQSLIEAKEKTEELRESSENFEKHMGGAESFMASLGKKSVFFSININTMAENFAKTFSKEKIEAYAKAFKNQFLSPSNFLVSLSAVIIETTAKLVKSADKATTSLSATTGMGRSLNDVLISSQRTGNLFGLSMEEAGKAIGSLVSSTTNFVNTSKATKTTIATNVGLLSKLGVSAEDSAKMIQGLNLNLGMTMEQASKTSISLAMMGTELGISASKMTKDFNDSLGTLAVYGPKATTVFKNLAGAAKAAGVETSKLLGIAKKFDTFSEAANTVGRLNALLGTQLSTTQMLMKTEDERIETLIDSVQAQGVAFKDMDRFKQKAIAAAAGIDDLAEAQRIFGMDVGMYKEYQQQMKENEDAQAKFQEAIDATIPIATKIMSIFNEFGIMVMPILEGIHSALDGVKEAFGSVSTETKEFLGKLILLSGGIVMVGKFLAPFLGIVKVLGATIGIGGAGAAAGGLTAGVGGLGAAFVGLGGAILPVLGGLGLLVGLGVGLSKIFSSFESSGVSNAAQDISKLNATSVKASSILENAAAVSTGAATKTLTGKIIQASQVNVSNSHSYSFPDKVVLKIGEKELEAVVMPMSRRAVIGS